MAINFDGSVSIKQTISNDNKTKEHLKIKYTDLKSIKTTIKSQVCNRMFLTLL